MLSMLGCRCLSARRRDNLTDKDMRLIGIVKSIAEEADSFARKVEKKHPLLKKLVEELYRAFHMLANAFPDQLSIYMQFDRIRETPQDLETEDGSRIPEKESGTEGSQQLNGHVECDAQTDDNEVEALKKALKTLRAEKESFHLLYRLSTMETERRILNELEICKRSLENGVLQGKEDNFKLIELCRKHPDKQLGEVVHKDETLGKNSHLDREGKAQVEVLQDLEQKDSSQSFVEASELSEKSTMETEIEAIEQQLGTDFLWDEIDNLKKELVESKAARERVEKQITELFQICEEQKKEIKHIGDRKGFLSTEIDEPRVREKYVCSEQEDRSKELELWDAESASFYFDLPESAAREVLFETKAQEELTGCCETSSVGSSESEIRMPKTKLSAYVPVVSSLKLDTVSLEKTAVIRRESKSRHGNKAFRSQRTQNGIRGTEQGSMKKQGSLRLRHKREDSSCESVSKIEVSRSFPEKAKILKRLGSGSRKLMSVSSTVKDLRTRIDTWERTGRTKSSDLEKVRRQLKEMEDSVSQLIHTNDALRNDVKKQRT